MDGERLYSMIVERVGALRRAGKIPTVVGTAVAVAVEHTDPRCEFARGAPECICDPPLIRVNGALITEPDERRFVPLERPRPI